MAQREYSNYQKKVIGRYYDNRDQIDEQRLSELVTNLYLATTEKQKDRLWKSAEETMTRLKVPPTRVEHVIARREPEILAEVVKDIQSGAIKVGRK
ncbi:MAG: hypothetical protein DWQ34_19710 [Planctomycetota bacterium]|nr:MAG: hypothetical protein DWQ34_19710 [Planctomycetota bacterium]REK29034.1 MAG: hypothetical protein DWQ41_05210 [Planctomycetota bacterium]REK39720.1 MAG: hypothetical protein DWQ45_01735 [Planctomycetota bacterium]